MLLPKPNQVIRISYSFIQYNGIVIELYNDLGMIININTIFRVLLIV